MTDTAPTLPVPTHEVAARPLLVPLSLRIDPIERLLLLDVRDDPLYTGFEVQWIDDPAGAGTGVVVLACLPDRRVDVYVEPALHVDPEAYAVGAGLAGWCRAPFRKARWDLTDAGAQVDIRLDLLDGRELELRVHERGRSRARLSLLAPMGHSFRSPTFLPFFWLEDFTFLRHARRDVVVRIGGRERPPVRIGMPWRLPRYCGAPLTAALNEAVDGPVPVLEVDRRAVHVQDGTAVTVSAVDGGSGIVQVSAVHGGGRLALHLDPPLPPLDRLTPDERREGDASATVDDVEVFGGRYRATRRADEVRLRLDVDRPWRPRMASRWQRALFGVLRVMRTWPTTYRWEAVVDLSAAPPTMRSGWERIR